MHELIIYIRETLKCSVTLVTVAKHCYAIEADLFEMLRGACEVI